MGDLSDPERGLAMQYCAPRGIPLSVFAGRVVNPGEPRWLADDIRAALTWQIEQNLKCPGCGLSLAETTLLENDQRYTAQPTACHACKTKSSAARAHAGIDDLDSSAGVLWHVTRDVDVAREAS